MNSWHPVVLLYIEINALLLLALAASWSIERLNKALGFRISYGARLTTARWLFLLVFICPLLWLALPTDILPQTQVSATIQAFYSDVMPAGIANPQTSPPPVKQTFNWPAPTTLALLLWGLGLLYCLTRTIIRVTQLGAILKHSFLYKAIGAVRIKTSDKIIAPFSTRLFGKQHILIPANFVHEPAMLTVVIAHEGQHLRNGDTNWVLLIECVRLLCYCNPAIYAWQSKLNELQEFACDEHLLESGKLKPTPYAQCLLRVAEILQQVKPHKSKQPCIASASICGQDRAHKSAGSQLKRRVEMLLKRNHPISSKLHDNLNRIAQLGLLVMASLLLIETVNGDDQTLNTPRLVLHEMRLVEATLDGSTQAQKQWSRPQYLESLTGTSYEDLLTKLEGVANYRIIAKPGVPAVHGSSVIIGMAWPDEANKLDPELYPRATWGLRMEANPLVLESGDVQARLNLYLPTKAEHDANMQQVPQHRFLKIDRIVKPNEVVAIPYPAKRGEKPLLNDDNIKLFLLLRTIAWEHQGGLNQ